MIGLRNANTQWLSCLGQLLQHGERIAPRGRNTLEQLHATLCVALEDSLVTIAERGINYKFAAAEALWIINGDDSVEALTKYNSRMREFSDDGVTLAGAYGPRLVPQFGYVVDTLLADRNTRQAVASIWTPNPLPSKDIPCTIALTFMVRDNRFHCHAFMRSSDVWLGVPYDLFSFSQVALYLLAMYNAAAQMSAAPGQLWLTAASSHMYESDEVAAKRVLIDNDRRGALTQLPDSFNYIDVIHRLERLREHGREDIGL